jgi:hypothetical protein
MILDSNNLGETLVKQYSCSRLNYITDGKFQYSDDLICSYIPNSAILPGTSNNIYFRYAPESGESKLKFIYNTLLERNVILNINLDDAFEDIKNGIDVAFGASIIRNMDTFGCEYEKINAVEFSQEYNIICNKTSFIIVDTQSKVDNKELESISVPHVSSSSAYYPQSLRRVSYAAAPMMAASMPTRMAIPMALGRRDVMLMDTHDISRVTPKSVSALKMNNNSYGRLADSRIDRHEELETDEGQEEEEQAEESDGGTVDWFNMVDNLKDKRLINVSKPVGVNSIGCSLKNANYDFKDSLSSTTLLDYVNFDGSFSMSPYMFNLLGVTDVLLKKLANKQSKTLEYVFNTLVLEYLQKLNEDKYKLIIEKLRIYLTTL